MSPQTACCDSHLWGDKMHLKKVLFTIDMKDRPTHFASDAPFPPLKKVLVLHMVVAMPPDQSPADVLHAIRDRCGGEGVIFRTYELETQESNYENIASDEMD